MKLWQIKYTNGHSHIVCADNVHLALMHSIKEYTVSDIFEIYIN